MPEARRLTDLDAEFPMNAKDFTRGPLWAMGNTQLLDGVAVGICGSRDASSKALEWAYLFGEQAAKAGLTVVSGYARGVDRQAHKGALAAGGRTIAVLPEGISHFRIVRELRPFIDMEANFLALSMFEPDAIWQVSRAMQRNGLIVALSVGLFVIEAKDTGGTINAAYECVRQGKHLWAIAYSQLGPGREGNEKLLAGAAIPLTGTADLRKAIEQAMREPPASVRQLVMNVMADDKSASRVNNGQ